MSWYVSVRLSVTRKRPFIFMRGVNLTPRIKAICLYYDAGSNKIPLKAIFSPKYVMNLLLNYYKFNKMLKLTELSGFQHKFN